jgi:murein DD-endopeptidase MepM/ murein hydrolase activator NlpD
LIKTLAIFLIVCCALFILPSAMPEAARQTPTPRALAQISATPSVTPTATIAPTLISTAVPNFISAESALWTPPAPINRVSGNFLFRRPFSFQHNTYWSREYSYGSTKRGQLQIHHGLDFANPSGVAVLAVADGIVYYAGPDIGRLFGPRPDFYGILVVIEHPYMYNTGEKIYTLYGHLRTEAVYTGQSVRAGDVIGYVGATGVALGPHLHFEVRVGAPESYDATRNPELWLIPYEGAGVVAGTVRDIYGNKLEGVALELQAPGNNHLTFSYSGTRVNGDNRLGENFVFADVNAGYYYLIVKGADGGLAHRQLIYVWAGQVTFVEVFIAP